MAAFADWRSRLLRRGDDVAGEDIYLADRPGLSDTALPARSRPAQPPASAKDCRAARLLTASSPPDRGAFPSPARTPPSP